MYIFKSELEEAEVDGTTFPNVSITISSEADLPSVVAAFESFLKAAGFVFDGELDFVTDEGKVVEEESV